MRISSATFAFATGLTFVVNALPQINGESDETSSSVTSASVQPDAYPEGQPSSTSSQRESSSATEVTFLPSATDLITALPQSTQAEASASAGGQQIDQSALGSERGKVDEAPLVKLAYLSDTTKCLALANPVPKAYDPVVVVDCSLQEERLQWRYVDGVTQVKSAVAGGREWCLDGGEADDLHQTVIINECYEGTGETASQLWWYSGVVDGHLAMYQQSRCLDVEDGKTENGGHLQTWQCFFGNTNQMFMPMAV